MLINFINKLNFVPGLPDFSKSSAHNLDNFLRLEDTVVRNFGI